MAKNQRKRKFIKELQKTPIVQIVCEKVGISRQTYYRWQREDYEFKKGSNAALEHGVDLVNDVAESNVLKGIQNEDAGYTKFWLSRRHDKYRLWIKHEQQNEPDPEEIKIAQEKARKEIELFQERFMRTQEEWKQQQLQALREHGDVKGEFKDEI